MMATGDGERPVGLMMLPLTSVILALVARIQTPGVSVGCDGVDTGSLDPRDKP